MTFDKSVHPHYKEVTLGQVIEAIEQNGLPKIKSNYFEYRGQYIVAACAIGQAAINLEVVPEDLYEELNRLVYDENEEWRGFTIGDFIALHNDTNFDATLPQIAQKLREKIAEHDSLYTLETKGFVRKHSYDQSVLKS